MSGIKNIKNYAKKYQKARIYFHMDLDGVMSAICMKEYLKQYNISTVEAYPIQYGDIEYKVPYFDDDTLNVMVDFANCKRHINIQTDHHNRQITMKGISKDYTQADSNAGTISSEISSFDIMDTYTKEVVNFVDSAKYTKYGFTPRDSRMAMFILDKSESTQRNYHKLGIVTNKLLLAYKNKISMKDKCVLTRLVLESNPSILSMYLHLKSMIKETLVYKNDEEKAKRELSDFAEYEAKNWMDISDVVNNSIVYYEKQVANTVVKDSIDDVWELGFGQHYMYKDYIIQYGGGNTFLKGGYTRFVPFEIHPEAKCLFILWPMGLIQVSKNPWYKGENKIDIQNIFLNKVMPKFDKKFHSIEISLLTIKEYYESGDYKFAGVNKNQYDYTYNSVGYKWSDLESMGLDKADSITCLRSESLNTIKELMNKQYKELSETDMAILFNVKISLYDIFNQLEGGHADIINIPCFNFVRIELENKEIFFPSEEPKKVQEETKVVRQKFMKSVLKEFVLAMEETENGD